VIQAHLLHYLGMAHYAYVLSQEQGQMPYYIPSHNS